MRLLRDLISAANLYLADVPRASLNVRLLETVASYVTSMLCVFGVVPSDVGIGFPLEGSDSTANVVSLREFCHRLTLAVYVCVVFQVM